MPSNRFERRLSAIVFTDLVGYSALAQRDEFQAIRNLETHRRLVRALLPKFRGREIETAGDSFLIEFASPRSAVLCALALQGAHADHARGRGADQSILVRIGVHLGDIEHHGGKVFGDGVNVAARIERLAPGGGLALTAAVHDHIGDLRSFGFRSLGPQVLKDVVQPIEVFILDAGTIAAQAPAVVVPPSMAPRKTETGREPRVSRRWVLLALGAGAIVIIAAAAAVLHRTRHDADEGLVSESSLAVLPFETFGETRDQPLADALQDDLIARLATVGGLKLISRNSMRTYTAGGRDPQSIARELGVANILEGSLQHSGDRVRVNAQLIRVADGSHLWAGDYDRGLGDVFLVQSDLAQQIAHKIRLRLDADQQRRLDQAPTRSLDAYEAYLEAYDTLRDPALGFMRDWSQALAQLEAALVRDPHFAAALAVRSRLHARLYYAGIDPAGEHRRQAFDDARAALKLDGGGPEPHLALGNAEAVTLDFPAAIAELETALKLAPENADAWSALGWTQKHAGLWDAALASLGQAEQLDPHNEAVLSIYGTALVSVRRYAEADARFARLETLAAEPLNARLMRADLARHWHGDLGPLRAAMAALPAEGDDGACSFALLRYELHWWQREFREAAASLAGCPEWIPGNGGETISSKGLRAEAVARFDPGAGNRLALEAANTLATQLDAHPEAATARAQAATLLGLLGDCTRALAQAGQAEQRMPPSRDARIAAEILAQDAPVRDRCGERTAALAQVRQLLVMPGGPSAHDLELDPSWDGLRNDPEFLRITIASAAGTLPAE